MNLRTASLAVVLMVAGCAHYSSAPIDTQALVRQQEVARLDGVAVQTKVHVIAPGAEAVPGQWNRLTLLAAALLYNPDIAAARAAVDTAIAHAGTAKQAPGMTLTLAAEYADETTANSPWLLGGALDVPLDIGGVRRSRIADAALVVDDARYAYADRVWTVRMAIDRALIDRISSKQQAAFYHRLAGLRGRQLSAMERRVEAGEASRTDLERVRAEGADAARLALDADRSIDASKIELAVAVGIPTGQLENIDPDWRGYSDPAPLAPERVSEAQLRQAMLARPDILRAMVAYGHAEASLRAEVARQYPQITIGPGYTWERGLVKLPLNIGLALPPLDFNRHAIAAAEADRSEKGKLVEAVVAAAGAAVDRALNECAAARAAWTHVRDIELPTAKRLADRADRELAAGAINRVDWAAAQAGALTARIDAGKALTRVQQADAVLEDALHRPLSGPELLIAQDRGNNE